MKMNRLVLRSFFLVMVTGLIFSSCKKDDSTTDPIVGTWTAGTHTFASTVGDKTLSQYYVDVMGYTQEEADSFVALSELILAGFFTGTITVKSDKTYTSNLGGTADSGTWSLNSGETELTINSTTDGPTTLEVVELTSSRLHLHTTEITTEDLNSDGTDETINTEIDVIFTK
jgi:hypothetical protein